MKVLHIKFSVESVSNVHYDGCASDYTFCGLEKDGDDVCQMTIGEVTADSVDCPQCLILLSHAMTIAKQAEGES